jgi:autotransporter adhesin
VSSGTQSTALGPNSTAAADYSTAVGYASTASGESSAAFGPNASAAGSSSIALGSGASAPSANSVALGAGSVADRANTVSVGNASTGQTRQIANVAAGTQGTDAVNVSQLNGATEYARAMGAMSAAAENAGVTAAGMPGKSRVALGAGCTGDQAALGLAYQQVFGRAAATLSGSSDGSNSEFGAGVGFSW